MIAVPWDAERIAALQPSVDANPWGPLEGPLDVFGGALLYEFTQGGAHALLAVRPVALARGVRLDAVGLVSTGDRLQAGAIDGALVAIARQHGAQQVAMCTQRAHVTRACARHGWEISGVVMTKGVGHVQ